MLLYQRVRTSYFFANWNLRGIIGAHRAAFLDSSVFDVRSFLGGSYRIWTMKICGVPIGVPPVIIHFNPMFRYKPTILGYHHDELEPSQNISLRNWWWKSGNVCDIQHIWVLQRNVPNWKFHVSTTYHGSLLGHKSLEGSINQKSRACMKHIVSDLYSHLLRVWICFCVYVNKNTSTIIYIL